ncbi:MAG: tetratricopeptide repeat protein [Treponema sp.]|nr:tetratricopeptide repeat protein [Treponema sp.]
MKTTPFYRSVCGAILIGVLLAISACTSDRDIYAAAPESVRERIVQADKLIGQQKYLTAFESLGDDDSDYIIAKKIAIVLKYFVASDRHLDFSLKDLEAEEDIEELRLYAEMAPPEEMIGFNPETAVQEYAAVHGMTPVLSAARGLYYYDILFFAPFDWVLSEEAIIQRAHDDLQVAIDADVYNADMLYKYAFLLYANHDFAGAADYFSRSTALDKKRGDAWFNYAFCEMQQAQYDTAIVAARRAVACYKNNPDYRLEAQLIIADAYAALGKYSDAEKQLQKSKRTVTGSYVPPLRLGVLYLHQGNIAKATHEFKTVYDANKENGDMFSTIITQYIQNNQAAAALDFCNDYIASSTDDLNMAMWYFFRAQIEASLGQREAALISVDESERYFLQTDGENTQQFDELREYIKTITAAP